MNDSPGKHSSRARRLIVGISGASGVLYGIRLLERLAGTAIETHLVMSPAAEVTMACETDWKVRDVKGLADHVHDPADMAASISSGSFKVDGMVVAPCSVKTMSEIAAGISTTLLTRAADVQLKERRRLVLMVRETPLHTGHLRSMVTLSEMGAVIAPPVPAFYIGPTSVMDLVDHSIGRALDLFDFEVAWVRRWGETEEPGGRPRRKASPRPPETEDV